MIRKPIVIALILLMTGALCRAQNVFPSSGNVGIGTSSPTYNLDIRAPNPEIRLFETASGGNRRFQINVGTYDEIRFTSTYGTSGNYPFTFRFGGGVQEAMRISTNGNVGIGTSNPQAKLAVNGNILATEVKVMNDISVPDYVFESDYELPTLQEVEAYVKQHKRLPEIPSAADIQRDGLNLAEMNLLLLKKVEELTLHLIEKEKKEHRVMLEMEEMKEEIEAIKRSITKKNK